MAYEDEEYYDDTPAPAPAPRPIPGWKPARSNIKGSQGRPINPARQVEGFQRMRDRMEATDRRGRDIYNQHDQVRARQVDQERAKKIQQQGWRQSFGGPGNLNPVALQPSQLEAIRNAPAGVSPADAMRMQPAERQAIIAAQGAMKEQAARTAAASATPAPSAVSTNPVAAASPAAPAKPTTPAVANGPAAPAATPTPTAVPTSTNVPAPAAARPPVQAGPTQTTASSPAARKPPINPLTGMPMGTLPGDPGYRSPFGSDIAAKNIATQGVDAAVADYQRRVGLDRSPPTFQVTPPAQLPTQKPEDPNGFMNRHVRNHWRAGFPTPTPGPTGPADPDALDRASRLLGRMDEKYGPLPAKTPAPANPQFVGPPSSATPPKATAQAAPASPPAAAAPQPGTPWNVTATAPKPPALLPKPADKPFRFATPRPVFANPNPRGMPLPKTAAPASPGPTTTPSPAAAPKPAPAAPPPTPAAPANPLPLSRAGAAAQQKKAAPEIMRQQQERRDQHRQAITASWRSPRTSTGVTPGNTRGTASADMALNGWNYATNQRKKEAAARQAREAEIRSIQGAPRFPRVARVSRDS